MKVPRVTYIIHLFLQQWQTWLLAAVLGKQHHWHAKNKIIWKVSFLQHHLKKILLCRGLYLY